MTKNAIKNCENLYEKVFVFKKENLTVGDMLWASLFYQSVNEITKEEMAEVIMEEAMDYQKVLAEVDFENEVVKFTDSGNYMEVPISVIQSVAKNLENK